MSADDVEAAVLAELTSSCIGDASKLGFCGVFAADLGGVLGGDFARDLGGVLGGDFEADFETDLLGDGIVVEVSVSEVAASGTIGAAIFGLLADERLARLRAAAAAAAALGVFFRLAELLERDAVGRRLEAGRLGVGRRERAGVLTSSRLPDASACGCSEVAWSLTSAVVSRSGRALTGGSCGGATGAAAAGGLRLRLEAEEVDGRDALATRRAVRSERVLDAPGPYKFCWSRRLVWRISSKVCRGGKLKVPSLKVRMAIRKACWASSTSLWSILIKCLISVESWSRNSIPLMWGSLHASCQASVLGIVTTSIGFLECQTVRRPVGDFDFEDLTKIEL